MPQDEIPADRDGEATHRCQECGAYWRLNQPLCTRDTGLKPGYPLHRPSWTLISKTCGKCCDLGDMLTVVALPIKGIDLGDTHE